MVSSKAVARDFRSEMDWGVAGRLQPCSSDNNSCTAETEREYIRKRGKEGGIKGKEE